ncbi:hypothetical protein E1301_Tti015876 [Triplophysa tibetana]|uniref:Uncharacterized protein n=1 Tax=Triplophysa tibetana TaxID=1572043 RepID=A0A5A9PF52_9TELE|nr:hypothetical protein E1301_Tti015876 [Triplophysa tibetana]
MPLFLWAGDRPPYWNSVSRSVNTREQADPLQHTVRGDDTIQEALYHLRDLTGYGHVLTFDLNVIYIPNSRIQSKEMCRCKEFIAQELLKTLLSVETTDQDAASALRLLQHNIRFLLQNSLGDQCLQDEVMVPMKNMSIDRQLMFIRLCITFFQNWMYKCISSSDF